MGGSPLSEERNVASGGYYPWTVIRVEDRMCALRSRHVPFCTVLLVQASESMGVSKGSLPAKPDGQIYPLETGPTQTLFARPRRSSS
jgi:hypothetical protein